MRRLNELENKIGYHFQDFSNLEHALRHSSFCNEQKMNRLMNNERLEFLGDAVLELVTSEFLYTNYPDMPEGEATRKRASMVCEQTLALCAKEIDLGSYLFLGKGEEQTGGRERSSVTSDAMEALIGAVYLDGGFTSAKELIERIIFSGMEDKQLFFDSKTIFQEMMQSITTEQIHYDLIGEEGPDHSKTFMVELFVGDRSAGKGSGKSKKSAEQAAAYDAIMKLKREK